MRRLGGPQPEAWLDEIHSIITTIESDAAAVAGRIATCKDPSRALALRAEWSKFIGHLTEMAVALSDLLERTIRGDRQAPKACKPSDAEP